MHHYFSYTCSFKFSAEKCLSLAIMSYNWHTSRHLRVAQNKPLDTEWAESFFSLMQVQICCVR